MKRLIFIVAMSLSGFGMAEVYKCASPGGGTRYSDQPCSLGKATLPVPDEKQSSSTPKKYSVNASGDEPPVENKKAASSTSTYTREQLEERGKAALARFNTTIHEQERLCENGNSKACCDLVAFGRGKIKNFKACATFKNFPYGDYWLVDNTASNYDKPSRKKDLEQAALAKRIPVGEAFDTQLSLFCFRTNPDQNSVVDGRHHLFTERILIKEDAGQPALHRLILRLKQNSKTIPPDGDEFATFDQMASTVCEK